MSVPPYTIPYDPHFLGGGIEVPLPAPGNAVRKQLHIYNDTHVLDYIHFSLAVHRPRHTALFSACNIDGRRIVKGINKKTPWKFDDRVADYQLGGEAYDGTAWDKGHLTKREDVVWGTPQEAKDANDVTFFYSNAAPQHGNFNRDEWARLEDWVFDWAEKENYKLCVLTGPVLRLDDRRLSEGDPVLERRVALEPEQILIPAAFWKILALRDESSELAVAAFAMRQGEMWNDLKGSKLLHLTVHQVTVDAIAEWTELDFGPLRDADVLAVSEERALRSTRAAGGEMVWPAIHSPEDLIPPMPSERRARVSMRRSASAMRKKSGCGCGSGDFDAGEAIAALSRDVARLTEAVAAMSPPSGGLSMNRALPGAAEATGNELPQDPQEQEREVARRISFDAQSADMVRIVGGFEVKPGEFLSTCCIGSFDEWFCTGILIHSRVVLTAAHCGSDITSTYFGEKIPPLGGTGKTIRVKNVIVHPKYDQHAFVRNDINLLILNEDCPHAPTPLATTAEIGTATDVELVGFGYSDPMKPVGFGTKRQVTVPMGVARKNANENLAALEKRFGFSSNHEFVAGRKLLGKDSCNGDSGGPAFVHAGETIKVAGVTSRATREATKNCGDGGIYVRLDVYVDWIRKVTAENGVQM